VGCPYLPYMRPAGQPKGALAAQTAVEREPAVKLPEPLATVS
jgi:hypothetical protein